ncbi:MAG: RIP metalloprotease [Acidimicrobiales bacterium]|nr:RIP metalloprotease [Hyphomonadaceae bacterium]RZV43135.1 MAG: RIP metalloprotease [Acidimicrobiales bacterium]
MIDMVVSTLIFGLSFIFVLSLLVFIHEMGHYSVARFFNVSVERFSIGFGKPLAKWTAKSGTQWMICRIPLGGYVKFLGDAGAASNPDQEQLKKIKAEMNDKHGQDSWKSCFHFKPLYQRTLVVLAGPMANFILAALIYMGFAMFLGIPSRTAVVGAVQPGTVAEAAGFQTGDEIRSINGDKIDKWRDLQQYVTLRSGEPLVIMVDREERQVELNVIPQRTTKTDMVGGKYDGGAIGIVWGGSYSHDYYNLAEAAGFGVDTVVDSISSTFLYIGRIFKGKEDGKALGGIVKIAAITGKAGMDASAVDGSVAVKAQAMVLTLLELAAALSVGLGFANLMPIPVLDGGHLVYYGYEAVMRRPLSERAQEIGFRVGFAALITLFLVLTWNDIGYVPDLFDKTG